MNLYAIRRPEAWVTIQEVAEVGARSARIGADMTDKVRWIRSYVVQEPDGKFGTICIYEARDIAAVQEHARRVGMPGDLVYPVLDTILVNPDPVAKAKAACRTTRMRPPPPRRRSRGRRYSPAIWNSITNRSSSSAAASDTAT